MHRFKNSIIAASALGLLALSLVFLLQPVKQARAAPSATPLVTLYEKLSGTSAVITSGVFNAQGMDDVLIETTFVESTSSRALSVNWLGSDGTTVLYTYSTTITAASGTAAIEIGRNVSNANNGSTYTASVVTTTSTSVTLTNPSIVTTILALPIMPGRRMSVTLAAASGATAGTAQLAVYGR